MGSLMYLKAHELERYIGIKFYTTRTPGINGKTRIRLSDFIVEEEVTIQLSKERSNYCIFLLEKSGVDTLEAIRSIAKKLKAHEKSIGYAGLKDASAITKQFISIPSSLLVNLNYTDQVIVINDKVKLKFLGYSHTPISLGVLRGNRFTIRVYDVDLTTVEDRIKSILRELEFNGGIPSFFGHQRFGTRRPNTHIIGKYLVLRLWDKAVHEIIGHPYPYEHERVREARILAEEGRYREALKLMPRKFWYERKILKLLNEGYKPLNILKRLPHDILKFFIQAYQAYLYNLILSKRLEYEIKPNEVVEGDIVFNVKTRSTRYEAKSREISHDEVILLPVPGCNVSTPKSFSLDIVNEVLNEEGVNFSMFKIKELGITLYGTLRYTPFKVYDFTYNLEGESIVFSFRLDKGMYATVVLREFMKCSPLYFT